MPTRRRRNTSRSRTRSPATGTSGSSSGSARRAPRGTNTTKAVILHSDGEKQKSRKVIPTEREKFDFGVQCKKEHTRKFEVYEQVDGKRIGSGAFEMKAGSSVAASDECNYRKFEITCDDDPDPGDDYVLTCKKVDEDLVRIIIENP